MSYPAHRFGITRFMCCLVALAHTLPGTAQPLAAAAQSPSSGAPAQYHRQFGYLPLKDGVRLAYVAWLPKKTGRYPTLILYGPYDESGADLDNYVGTYFIRPYLEAGYALVGINTRGTGCSEGVNDYSFVGEGVDGAQAVEWVAQQPWSTGNIGMVGNSSPGYTQFETAAQHPPHLKAIVPTGVAASDYREVWMVGGMTHQALISGWSLHVEPDSAQSSAETQVGRPPLCRHSREAAADPGPVPTGKCSNTRFRTSTGKRAAWKDSSVRSKCPR